MYAPIMTVMVTYTSLTGHRILWRRQAFHGSFVCPSSYRCFSYWRRELSTVVTFIVGNNGWIHPVYSVTFTAYPCYKIRIYFQATGSRLGTLFQSFSAMAAGIIIGFVFSWQLTLLILAFAPFIMLAGFVEMKIYTGNNTDRKSSEEAGKVTASFWWINTTCVYLPPIILL